LLAQDLDHLLLIIIRGLLPEVHEDALELVFDVVSLRKHLLIMFLFALGLRLRLVGS
jgi:hypothetical protein